MKQNCFEIKSLDWIKKQVEATNWTDAPKNIQNKCNELDKSVRNSDDILKGTDLQLMLLLKRKNGYRRGSEHNFTVDMLDFLYENLTDEEPQESRLVTLSKLVHSLQDEVEGTEEPEAILVSDDLQKLQEFEKAIEARNELIAAYGELFAKLTRCFNQSNKYGTNVELDDSYPLIVFLQSYFEKKREEELLRAAELLRAEEQKNAEDATANVLDNNFEPILKDSVEPITPIVTSEPSAMQSFAGTSDFLGSTPSVEEQPIITQSEASEQTQPEFLQSAIQSSESSTDSLPEGNRADVLFVVDASGSMGPCFDQLRAHIKSFVEPFKALGFTSLRLGLLAYSSNKNRSEGGYIYRNRFLCPDRTSNMSALYGEASVASKMFWTQSDDIDTGVAQFVQRLEQIKCRGDENTPFALDCAADFPFEPIKTTRRVIILFTDERIEDGVSKMEAVGENFSILEQIMDKVSKRHISLYYFGPQSEAAELMEEYPRVFVNYVVSWQQRHSDTETWGSLDMGGIMDALGKSISSSVVSAAEETQFDKAIFGQNSWPDEVWY